MSSRRCSGTLVSGMVVRLARTCARVAFRWERWTGRRINVRETMTRKKALMLTRDDDVILEICTRVAAASAAKQDMVNQLRADIDKLVQDGHKERLDALAEVEARLRKIGVLYDKKAHDVSFHPEEGVIWLESKKDNCQCPACQLKGLGIMIGMPHP